MTDATSSAAASGRYRVSGSFFGDLVVGYYEVPSAQCALALFRLQASGRQVDLSRFDDLEAQLCEPKYWQQHGWFRYFHGS